MNESANCQLCGQGCTYENVAWVQDVFVYTCPTCGKYGASSHALQALKDGSEGDRAKVSAFLRERSLQGEPSIILLTEMPSGVKSEKPIITIAEIIEERFPSLVSDRLDRILKNIHKSSKFPGERVRFYIATDKPVFFAENDEAMLFLAKTLEKNGLVSLGWTSGTVDITLTEAGWNRLAEMEIGKSRAKSNQVFVAMSFHASLINAWQHGFEKACNATGYKALRVDLKEHNEKICDAIIAEIRKSRFVVADFTGHRGGVYFEAGYALGLGIPVIWTCRKDELEKTHFDTRQYNHIDWENEEDLLIRLKNRIQATIPS